MDNTLGKIKSIKFGYGGYQDTILGFTIELGGESWGTAVFFGTWDPETVKRSEHTRWSEEDRTKGLADASRKISALLKEAKVNDMSQLVGKPIKAEFDGNMLKDWRILTEVL